MKTAIPIILTVLFIVTLFLIFCWIFVAACCDEILGLIAKIKPFNAKRKYKKDLRNNIKKHKRLIRNERDRLRKEIETTTEYIYSVIIYKENIDWLKRKGFKVTHQITDRKECFYEIRWDI